RTRRPANAVFRCIEKVIPGHVVSVVAVADQGHAAFAIDQPSIKGVADPTGYTGEKIGRRSERSGVAGNSKVRGLADISTSCRTSDSDNPSGRKLIIAADLSTKHVPAYVKVCRRKSSW